jgi:hypothetical protein
MQGESPQQPEPAVNTTLTMESPPVSECSQKTNTTLTGDKTQEIVQSPPIVENSVGNDITNDKFPETACEYVQQKDTLDEITAAIELGGSDADDHKPENVGPISPIYRPAEEISEANEMTSQDIHETNISSSIGLENSQEVNSPVPVKEDKLENIEQVLPVNEEEPTKEKEAVELVEEVFEPALPEIQNNLSTPEQWENNSVEDQPEIFDKTNEWRSAESEITQEVSFKNLGDNTYEFASDDLKFNFTVPINSEANLSLPTPMDIDQTFSDDVLITDKPEEVYKEVEIIPEAAQEVEKPIEKPQQVFECEFVSQSVQELQFDFKTPEPQQQVKPDNLEQTLDMESPPSDDLHQSSEADKTPEEFKVPLMPMRKSVEKFESASACKSIATSIAKFKQTHAHIHEMFYVH